MLAAFCPLSLGEYEAALQNVHRETSRCRRRVNSYTGRWAAARLWSHGRACCLVIILKELPL